jgi:LysM repeat protein
MVSKGDNSSFSLSFSLRQQALLKGVSGAASFGVLALIIGLMAACSPLEPLVEPEVSDLQLTVDTLKTSLRDAQRTIAELRTEVDSRRQELADIQIARAQLEGRLREAERRLVEARHVIDLQREELAGSRSERERVARTGAVLQNQLKQLQKQLSKIGKPANDSRGAGMAPASIPSPRGSQSGVAPTKLEQPAPLEESTRVVATPAIHLQEESPVGGVPVSKQAMTTPVRVSVKPGDTLWSIAHRYRVPVKRLMAINQLPDNHIQVGQALWLIEPATAGEHEYEKTE